MKLFYIKENFAVYIHASRDRREHAVINLFDLKCIQGMENLAACVMTW